MNCPNCGTEVQEGLMSCPNCAAALPVTDNPYNVSTGPMAVPKKTNTGLIIGVVCGVAALLVVAVVCIVLLLGNGKDGTYVCKEMSAFGVDCTLKVDGNKFTLKMSGFGESEKESGKIKFSGKTVKLTVDGETIEGTYNKSKKTITFEGMTFTKK